MDLGITGKRALITGASQGIGRVIAFGLAKEGVSVVATARRAEVLQQLVDELGGESEGHSFIAADLMTDGEPARVAREAMAGGPIDIAMHNIGGPYGVRDALALAEDWRKVWQLNVGIPIEMNHELIPPMQQRNWGRVVHMSSQASEGLRGSAAYGPTKRSLDGYVKVLGRQVAPDGVVVSALQPGAYFAPDGHWDEVTRERPEMLADFLRHHQAVGRIGTADEISPLAVFMCSQQASFCAGSLMQIDGGTM